MEGGTGTLGMGGKGFVQFLDKTFTEKTGCYGFPQHPVVLFGRLSYENLHHLVETICNCGIVTQCFQRTFNFREFGFESFAALFESLGYGECGNLF